MKMMPIGILRRGPVARPLGNDGRYTVARSTRDRRKRRREIVDNEFLVPEAVEIFEPDDEERDDEEHTDDEFLYGSSDDEENGDVAVEYGEDITERQSGLTSLQRGHLLLDLLRWQKFNRTKTELIDDLRTTAATLPVMEEDSVSYPTSIYRVVSSVKCERRRRFIDYVCPEHFTILGTRRADDSAKDLVFECDGGQPTNEPHVLAPAQLNNSCILHVSVRDTLEKLLELYSEDVHKCLVERRDAKRAVGRKSVTDVTNAKFYTETDLEFSALTLLVHSDSAEKSESSTVKGYAVQWTLIELPAALRLNNIQLSTLWVGAGKTTPHRRIIYRRFVKEISELRTVGVKWFHRGNEIISPVYLTIVCADAMERFPLAGLSICHALYGCTVCLAPTSRWTPRGSTDGREGKQVFIPAETTATLRSGNETVRLSRALMSIVDERLRDEARLDPAYQGVTETSVFLGLHKFHSILSFGGEIMHNYFKGVLPLFLNLLKLTDVEIAGIDARTAMLDVPSVFSRKPRTWSERQYMKSNEFRDIMFYGFFALHGILNEEDFRLWITVANLGIVATKDVIEEEDRGYLDRTCHETVRRIYQRFGGEAMVFNIHQIDHISHFVRLFGNMSAYCALPYESSLGKLMAAVHNSADACREVANSSALCDVACHIRQTLDLSDLPVPVKLRIEEVSRTVYHRRAFCANGYVVLGMGKSISGLHKKNFATWKLLYDYLTSHGKVAERMLQTGQVYPKINIKRCVLSAKVSMVDNFADAIFYTRDNSIYRLRNVAVFQSNNDERMNWVTPLLVCQQALILPETPYNLEEYLPTLKVILWTETMVVLTPDEFCGMAFEFRYILQKRIVQLLPLLLYQMD